MPQWPSLEAFRKELVGLSVDFSESEIRAITRAQGKEAQDIATKAARADSLPFSGWNRGAPIQLDTRLINGTAGSTIMAPTRRSAGPWTVAELGRHQGNASGFHGPGINRRTGITSRTKSGAVRRVRATRSRRWNGTTRGKRTATDAAVVMGRTLPKIADKATLKVIRKRFDVT